MQTCFLPQSSYQYIDVHTIPAQSIYVENKEVLPSTEHPSYA